jgi:hypothetical protein
MIMKLLEFLQHFNLATASSFFSLLATLATQHQHNIKVRLHLSLATPAMDINLRCPAAGGSYHVTNTSADRNDQVS